jgi:hypothetical protein
MSNINYSDLKRIRQDELKTRADLIYSKMNNVAAYALFQASVTDLLPIADAYQQALIVASNGGTDRVNAKNEAKALLLNQLTKIGKFMDAEWQTPNFDTLKEEAGYTIAKTPEKKVVKFVDAPKNFSILNTGRKGDVIMEWDSVANARTYAFEELQADGTWKNGRYASTSPVVLSNLPLGLKLTMRMKTVGPENIVSDYTEPSTVWVS